MLTATDWIAVLTIAAPIAVKAFSDWEANAIANHNAALARIVGMAGREAATIARTLASAPVGDPKALESSLISNSAVTIMQAMGASTVTIGADSDKVAGIIQGEVDKLRTPTPIAAVPSAVSFSK
jgi:hypothetical protein